MEIDSIKNVISNELKKISKVLYNVYIYVYKITYKNYTEIEHIWTFSP